ncbi:hypothetical protein K402DRAFT_404539 [Aulographum hederae CBS 113979]|uniref:Uncharacterized protein n=1 Tax=Aulographum hederae CBS 113979 TaxID=1176131 RepID=A0A6G1GYQ7_9PEZI|nr:hypothetical protein K402DRAFT_404539 [Aulographum hederae CBS 113979]
MSIPCPFPNVEAALSPYIHPRHQTLRIRQALTEFLSSQIIAADPPVSHLEISCPPSTVEVKRFPPEASGLRKRYLEALQANATARARYDALKGDLESLRKESILAARNGKSGESAGKKEGEDDDVAEYVKLLRQRRLNAKLQVVQKSLGELVDAEANPTNVNLPEMLLERLGEAPEPPISAGGGEGDDERVEELTFRLKKEVLVAKNAMERSVSLQNDARQLLGGGEVSVEAQVHGMRAARDELISWVEGELAKISETGADTSIIESPVGSPVLAGEEEAGPVKDHTARIKTMYDAYVSARAALLADVKRASAVPNIDPSSLESLLNPRTISGAKGGSQGQSTKADASFQVADLIPHLPTLLTFTSSSNTLLHQSKYLRAALAAAEDDTTKTVQRLAGESYLVAPGASSMAAWADAARESRAETGKAVGEMCESGEESIRGAKGGVNRTNEERRREGGFRGDL